MAENQETDGCRRRPGAGKRTGLILAIALGGCGKPMSGLVLDAATDKPLAAAIVDLQSVGWGNRQGRLVWDAGKSSQTKTDAGGRFDFTEGGGVSLNVHAPGYPKVSTNLCSRSPMIVRVGGPYSDLRADRRLIFDMAASPAKTSDLAPPEATGADLGLRIPDANFDDLTRLQVEAKGGVRFIAGTGVIPSPPRLPYDQKVTLDPVADCGWLFVSDGTRPLAVIQVAPIGWEQAPGGPRRLVMLYTPLP